MISNQRLGVMEVNHHIKKKMLYLKCKKYHKHVNGRNTIPN